MAQSSSSTQFHHGSNFDHNSGSSELHSSDNKSAPLQPRTVTHPNATTVDVAIIGGGIGGFSIVTGLRDAGYEGTIALINPGQPYDRPPLSAEYLVDTDVGLTLATGDWPSTYRVDFRDTTVTRLVPGGEATPNTSTHTLHLADRTVISAHQVVLATGAEALPLKLSNTVDDGHGHRVPAQPPAHTDTVDRNDPDAPLGPVDPVDAATGLPNNIHTLRTLQDAETLDKILGSTEHIVVAGAGLLAQEIAASARMRDVKVTLFSPHPRADEALFGPHLARVLHQLHLDHGVTVIGQRLTAETLVQHFPGADEQQPVIIAAVGSKPSLRLARDAGVKTNIGVLVDAQQRSSNPSIFAVGDVAESAAGPHRHWDQARQDALAVVAAVMGEPVPQRSPEWVYSDRYGISAQAVGRLAESDHGKLIHRGKTASFLVEAEELRWAAAIGEPMTIRAAQRIMAKNIPVDPAVLADPDVPLRSLLKRR